jgi:hypothetical protein
MRDGEHTMSDLSPEDRALVDAGGRSDVPSSAARDRVRRKLAVRLGVGAGLGVVTAATKTAAATSAVTSLTMKIAIGVALLGALGAGGAALGVAARGGAVAAPSSLPSATAPSATAPTLVAVVETAPVPANAPPPPSAVASSPVASSPAAEAPVAEAPVAPSTAPVRPRTPVANGATTTAAAAVPMPSADDLVEETHLLREANVATRAGDPVRALALLEEHARRFPRGVLGEERDAERVLALCAAGRTAEAHAAAQRFLAARPGSALAGRVRSSCGGP